MQIQQKLIEKGYLVGAIRQPTVSKAILRVIIRVDVTKKQLLKLARYLKN